MLERPFLGSLLAYLPIVDSERCSSFDTDAECIYVNLRAVGRWDEQFLQFSLAHLTLHCALGHFHRRGHRERRRWHAACDYAVNQLLVEDGLPRPRRALWEARFKGL